MKLHHCQTPFVWSWEHVYISILKTKSTKSFTVASSRPNIQLEFDSYRVTGYHCKLTITILLKITNKGLLTGTNGRHNTMPFKSQSKGMYLLYGEIPYEKGTVFCFCLLSQLQDTLVLLTPCTVSYWFNFVMHGLIEDCKTIVPTQKATAFSPIKPKKCWKNWTVIKFNHIILFFVAFFFF